MNAQSPGRPLWFLRRAEPEEVATPTETIRRPKIPLVLRRITPYLGAIVALLLVAMVLLTMFFTWFDWQWVTFLSGILGAAILSLASRSIHAEWTIARRTAQLNLARQRLGREVVLRKAAEQNLACIETNTSYLQDTLPVMLACIDEKYQVTFHNRAFRHGLGAAVTQIEGRLLRDVVGSAVFGEMAEDLAGAFEGKVVHQEQLHKTSAGNTFRLLAQYLPRFNQSGTVSGVFLMLTDVTDPVDFALRGDVGAAGEAGLAASDLPAETADDRDAQAWEDSEARLRDALAHDDFCLFFQSIEPLAVAGCAVPLREVLLRLKAEEEGMLPPGSFLPVAEQCGMLPDLDRWVVRHLLDTIGVDPLRQQAVYSVNISPQSMVDPLFPAFVASALRDTGLSGSLLCFELQEAEMLERLADAGRFIKQLRSCGCQFAICGFTGDRAAFDLLRRMPVQYLKIDGGLILKFRRSAIDYARVKAIQRVAHAIGVITVAECVEDTRTFARLRSLGIDYAQGFGISHPQDLQQLFSDMAGAPAAELPQQPPALAAA